MVSATSMYIADTVYVRWCLSAICNEKNEIGRLLGRRSSIKSPEKQDDAMYATSASMKKALGYTLAFVTLS